MSEVMADVPAPPDERPRPEAGSGSGTWALTRHGVRTVARLELRQRVRSTRWGIVLAVWTVGIWGLSGLIWLGLGPMSGGTDEDVGRNVFGAVVFLVLTLGSLISPALSATSINGDRNAGVLATLQTTLLSPAEIAFGKLLAAWITSLALLLTAAPAILFGFLLGGTPVGRMVVTLVLLALTLLVVCAIGLGCSAIAARTSSSAVLSYVSVAFLGLGLPLLFALSLPFTTVDETVTVREAVSFDESGNTVTCQTRQQEMERTRTELTWWILAPSPYVVVADASPRPRNVDGDDVLTGIRNGVRELRLGQPDELDWCGTGFEYSDPERARERDRLGWVWPFGLAADLLVGAAFTVTAVRRLRTPNRKLPRGTRVA